MEELDSGTFVQQEEYGRFPSLNKKNNESFARLIPQMSKFMRGWLNNSRIVFGNNPRD